MTDIQYHTPLSLSVLRQYHVPEPWGYGVADRVRFGELDALGHVSNVAYLRWFETFRVHYLRDYGLTDYATLTGPRMVLRRVEVDYRAEMHISEDYIVAGRTVSLRNSSCVMEYAVWSNSLRATGSAVLVFIEETGSKKAIPTNLRDNMMTHDAAQDLR